MKSMIDEVVSKYKELGYPVEVKNLQNTPLFSSKIGLLSWDVVILLETLAGKYRIDYEKILANKSITLSNIADAISLC